MDAHQPNVPKLLMTPHPLKNKRNAERQWSHAIDAPTALFVAVAVDSSQEIARLVVEGLDGSGTGFSSSQGASRDAHHLFFILFSGA